MREPKGSAECPGTLLFVTSTLAWVSEPESPVSLWLSLLASSSVGSLPHGPLGAGDLICSVFIQSQDHMQS